MVKKLQFSETIAAPVERVVELMIGPESYREWTSEFAEGSYYEGSWEEGQTIRFLVPPGDGMVAEIAEHRPNEFLSIRHLGVVANGVDDTASEEVRAWAPAYENYSFVPTPEGTKVVVDQDVTEDFEAMMAEMWPRALARLKALCEADF
jgi:hypothetical protein